MIVRVKLSEVFIDRHPELQPGKSKSVTLPNGSAVGDLLQHLKLTAPGIAFAVIDNQVAESNRRLKDGDRVTVLPVVEGG